MNIRPVQEEDLKTIRQLNELAVPHVNSIGMDDFRQFMKMSSFFRVIEQEGEIAGFMIALGPGQPYDSKNYRYFSNYFSSFDYVDRIVIDEKHRGKGLGSALYHQLFDVSESERITCEVNQEPPNPGSLEFHKALGFSKVGEQYTEGGRKRVALLVKRLK